MAPHTRLRAEPGRRVKYTTEGMKPKSGSAQNPIIINKGAPIGPLSATTPARPYVSTKGRRAPAATRESTTKETNRITKTQPKKAAKKTMPTKVCSLCASTKTVSRGFKILKSVQVCEHFPDICSSCVSTMIKVKVTDRKLDEGVLKCPFPDCECVLDLKAVKQIITPAGFKVWENELTLHYIRMSDSYVSCVNAKCGKYFSIESCKSKTKRKQQALCPYCTDDMCLTCFRPWHPYATCEANTSDDDKKTEAAIRAMGAKPCPQCGLNIQKTAGCDHMICRNCHHNFCMICLVEYKHDMQHAPHCQHSIRGNIANDPGNWINGTVPNAVPQMGNAIVAQPVPRGPAPVFNNPPPPIPNWNPEDDIALAEQNWGMVLNNPPTNWPQFP